MTTWNVAEIGVEAQVFFGDLFRASPYQMDETLFDEIPTSVLEDDNISFCAIPSQEEIWHAIKHMNSASLTGNDSFTCYFYLACWGIIKAEQCAFVLDFFFQRSYLPRGISDTTLILMRIR